MWIIIKQFAQQLNTWLLMNILQHFMVAVALGSIFQKSLQNMALKFMQLVDVKTYFAFNLKIYPRIQPPGLISV